MKRVKVSEELLNMLLVYAHGDEGYVNLEDFTTLSIERKLSRTYSPKRGLYAEPKQRRNMADILLAVGRGMATCTQAPVLMANTVRVGYNKRAQELRTLNSTTKQLAKANVVTKK